MSHLSQQLTLTITASLKQQQLETAPLRRMRSYSKPIFDLLLCHSQLIKDHTTLVNLHMGKHLT